MADADEWDEDFVDQIVQAEESAMLARSSQLPPPQPPPFQPPAQAWSLNPPIAHTWRLQPRTPSSPPPRRFPPPPVLSYSPPRELSQRPHQAIGTSGVPDFHESVAPHGEDSEKERELGVLKEELKHVSKQLSHLEKECLELRKEKEKNLEQLKVLNSRIEAKDADANLRKNIEMDGSVCNPLDSGIPATCQNTKPSNKQQDSCTKSCVTGRDKATEVSTSASQETSFHSKKLLGLWNSNDQKQGGVLVAKLYKTCEMDFQELFGYLNSPQNGSDMTSSDQQGPLQPIEFIKVLHLHSVFTKISNDNLRLEDLLKALVDLCSLKNEKLHLVASMNSPVAIIDSYPLQLCEVFIVHWSLRLLHKILSDFSNMEKEFGKRKNVTVEDSISPNVEHDTNRCGTEKESLNFAAVAEMLKQGQFPSALELTNAKTPDSSISDNHSFAASVSGAYQVSLFENMRLIATESDDERVRCESLSIMNLILMRHNAYSERDKFAGELVFQSLSKLLRRKAGFSVQDQAVQFLYLLCNCPKVIAMIFSCLKEEGELDCSKDVKANYCPTLQELNEILIGLADCVACHGTATAEEMKLRRNAIFFLAFLGSSGKPGFEILLNHRLPGDCNFLFIILQSILSDLDRQAKQSDRRSGIHLEQSLMIREALILLNRLVSHPQYSVTVLNALTATRDEASLTVEFANRLNQKSKLLWQDDYTTKQARESEILDLARLFKKRVFTFLGDSIS